MQEGVSQKSNNLPLQQFRFKINQQRKFLRKFYTPDWFYTPGKTSLIINTAVWLFAVIILVWNKSILHTPNFYLLLVTTAIPLLAQCIAYRKFKRKNGHFL